MAIILVCWIFGWTGGKQLIGESYADAKLRIAQIKADREHKKAEKRAVKQSKKDAQRQSNGA